MSGRTIDWEARQDVIEWLEGIRDHPSCRDVGAPFAVKALDLLKRYDSRESTVIGMLPGASAGMADSDPQRSRASDLTRRAGDRHRV